MTTSGIRHVLDQALAAPRGEQSLKRYIRLFDSKHPALLKVEHGSTDARLNAMLVQYCRLLPVLLQEASVIDRTDRGFNDFRSLHAVVINFFVSLEPRRLKLGILGILDKVYFGQRLIEEWHDRCKLISGCTLLSWDTALANLLVHSLLGETYANELDAAVLEIIEQPGLTTVTEAPTASRIRSSTAPPCPCLATRHGISLLWNHNPTDLFTGFQVH